MLSGHWYAMTPEIPHCMRCGAEPAEPYGKKIDMGPGKFSDDKPASLAALGRLREPTGNDRREGKRRPAKRYLRGVGKRRAVP